MSVSSGLDWTSQRCRGWRSERFFFSSVLLLQFLSDPYPPVEREHRDGTAGSASGREERGSGGEYARVPSHDQPD